MHQLVQLSNVNDQMKFRQVTIATKVFKWTKRLAYMTAAYSCIAAVTPPRPEVQIPAELSRTTIVNAEHAWPHERHQAS